MKIESVDNTPTPPINPNQLREYRDQLDQMYVVEFLNSGAAQPTPGLVKDMSQLQTPLSNLGCDGLTLNKITTSSSGMDVNSTFLNAIDAIDKKLATLPPSGHRAPLYPYKPKAVHATMQLMQALYTAQKDHPREFFDPSTIQKYLDTLNGMKTLTPDLQSLPTDLKNTTGANLPIASISKELGAYMPRIFK